jgi:hypothetical protein
VVTQVEFALHQVGTAGWPFFVIVPGLGLLGLGLATPGRLGEVLATVGGVVTMVGLVLLVQNATDRFETWAYAWALVFLVGAGFGRWLVGTVRGRPRAGRQRRLADQRWAGRLPGLCGVLRGRGRDRRSPERSGQPLRPGGPADPGRLGPAGPQVAGGQAAMSRVAADHGLDLVGATAADPLPDGAWERMENAVAVEAAAGSFRLSDADRFW